MAQKLKFKILFSSIFILFIISSACSSSNKLFSRKEVLISSPWEARIISTEKTLDFGGWTYEESDNAEFLVVTIEYTNISDEIQPFWPQSVLLLYPEGSSYPGIAQTVSDYQVENSNFVTNFAKQNPILSYINPQETKTDKFGWEIYMLDDTKFQILFPESKPIEIITEPHY
jgi:hypothetical protein